MPVRLVFCSLDVGSLLALVLVLVLAFVFIPVLVFAFPFLDLFAQFNTASKMTSASISSIISLSALQVFGLSGL